MKTYVAKPGEADKKWHRAVYTPHVDTGDNVIVINAEKVVFSGNKTDDKIYYRHSGYPGGLKERRPRQLYERLPERILELAVGRMLKRGPLQRKLMRNLKVYKGPEHPHAAQKPEPLDVKSLNRKNVRS
jgi:large subunit ribosomal protein L13